MREYGVWSISFAAVAITRIAALSRSMWDWDEALFCLGVRHYDVPAYRPHPPGFPLFIGAAKLLRPIAGSDFHALQWISLLAACSLFPLAYLLARELRFSKESSFLAALLFVFFPTVWFYGGTAFSDIPALALSLGAALSFFRGYWAWGALLLGIAIGVRPQSLLLGGAPFLTFAWSQRKEWKRIAAAIAVVTAIAATSYVGAALSSPSLEAYGASVAKQGRYIYDVDSIANPARASMTVAARELLLRPMAGGRLSIVVCALALVGLAAVRQGPRVVLACATFAPFAIFALFMLDVNSAHRFATAYLFLYALLAAEGARLLTARLPGVAQAVVIATIVGRYVWWTWPALAVVRSSDSPPVAAMRSLRAADVDFSLEPFAGYFLADRASAPAVMEGLTPAASARVFARPRGRAWEIARHRHFEVSIVPPEDRWTFGNGWYDQEDDGRHAWRWMGGRGVATLPALADRGRLSLTIESVAPRATVEVRVDGALLDRFECTPQGTTKEWRIAANHAVTLELWTSAIARVPGDPRTLGLRLTRYDWRSI